MLVKPNPDLVDSVFSLMYNNSKSSLATKCPKSDHLLVVRNNRLFSPFLSFMC